MQFAAASLLLAVLSGSLVNAAAVEPRDCSVSKASAAIKHFKYQPFCSSLIRPTATATNVITTTVTGAGSTITDATTPYTTVTGATTLFSTTFNTVTTTAVVTSTVANPNVSANARNAAAYTAPPKRPSGVAKCSYDVLSKACKQVVTKRPKGVTATVTAVSTVTADGPVATVDVTAAQQTATVISTASTVVTGTKTATTQTNAVVTQAAYLAFMDTSVPPVKKELALDETNATPGDGVTADNAHAPTSLIFTPAAATGHSANENGLVSGFFSVATGFSNLCLSNGGATQANLKLIACPAKPFSVAAHQFSVDPTYKYVYAGVFPSQIQQFKVTTAKWKFDAGDTVAFLSNATVTF